MTEAINSLGNGIVGLGILIVTVYNGWQSFQAKRAARTAKESTAAVAASTEAVAASTQAVEKTLTTNNGGSHVKDSLDRLEHGMAAISDDLANHKQESRDRHADTTRRLEAVEARPQPRYVLPALFR